MQLTEFGINAILNLNSLRAVKVLFILGENADNNGESKITLTDIGKKIGINHKANVSQSIKELEENNFIAVQTIKKKNIYILNPDFFVTLKPYPEVMQKYSDVKAKKKTKKEVKSLDDLLNELNLDFMGDTNV